MKIVFTGGGTAGHLFPVIAIIRELREIYPGQNLKIYFAGPKNKHIDVLMKQEKVLIKHIICGKIRRYISFKNIIDVFKVPIGILQSLFWLFFLAPDIIFCKGGYGAFPVSMAAAILRIPLILHESDIAPGFVSKIISKWAVEIFTSFPDTEYFPKNKTLCIGNPIRMSLLRNQGIEKKDYIELLSLQGGKPIILFLGGSQGAQCINQLVLDILPNIIKKFEIIHQTGLLHQKSVQEEASAILTKEEMLSYHPFAFLNENYLSAALNIADLVVSRSGSGAIFEIAAFSKPMILIPLFNSAQDHQLKNAYKVAEFEATKVVEEQNLKPHLFIQLLENLFSVPETLKEMSKNAKEFSRPKAAFVIANYLKECLLS